ncbi:hypothetical protein AAMO2058_000389600 [Amorphochlora amoebiformis]
MDRNESRVRSGYFNTLISKLGSNLIKSLASTHKPMRTVYTRGMDAWGDGCIFAFDALIDTGATMSCMYMRSVRRMGKEAQVDISGARLAAGPNGMVLSHGTLSMEISGPSIIDQPVEQEFTILPTSFLSHLLPQLILGMDFLVENECRINLFLNTVSCFKTNSPSAFLRKVLHPRQINSYVLTRSGNNISSVKFVIDSGAGVSTIGLHTVKALGLEHRIKSTWTTGIGIGGVISFVGSIDIDLDFDGTKVSQRFLVDEFSSVYLLGADFLIENECDINALYASVDCIRRRWGGSKAFKIQASYVSWVLGGITRSVENIVNFIIKSAIRFIMLPAHIIGCVSRFLGEFLDTVFKRTWIYQHEKEGSDSIKPPVYPRYPYPYATYTTI